MKILMTLTDMPYFSDSCISFGRDTQSPQEIIQIRHSEMEPDKEFQICSTKNTRLHNCYKIVARRLNISKIEYQF